MRGTLARKQVRKDAGQARSQASGSPRHGVSNRSDDLPQLSSFSHDDAAKVTKLQAQARGRLARKQMAEQKSPKSTKDDLPDLNSFSQNDKAKLTHIQAH